MMLKKWSRGRAAIAAAVLLGLGFAGSASTGAASLVPLRNATATYTQPNPSVPGLWSPAKTIDGRISGQFTSWATVNRNVGPGGDVNRSEAIVWETVSNLSLDGREPIQFSLHFKDSVPVGNRGLGRFKISYTTDPRRTFANGLDIGGDVMANWMTIDLIGLRSDSGEAFDTLADGSILVAAGTGTKPSYYATALLSVANITGFRLDALEHSSLPFGGPGAGGVGGAPVDLQNFHLSEFQVEVVPLPASLPLLAAGVGALAWLGRAA